MEITNALMSSNPQHLQKTLMRLSLMGPLPSINVLLKMSHLLLDPSNHPNNPRIMVASYLKNSAKDDDVRQKVSIYELLHSRTNFNFLLMAL